MVNDVVVRMVGIVRNVSMFLGRHFMLDCVVDDKRGKSVEKILESGDADFTSFNFFDPVSAQKFFWKGITKKRIRLKFVDIFEECSIRSHKFQDNFKFFLFFRSDIE